MKVIASATLFAILATQSFAGSWETRCTTQSVPYQETVKGGNAGDVVGGAIVGGIIGKGVTGQDSGAAVGAIIGGAVANENSRRTVTRYRDVETCKRVYIPAKIYDNAALRQAILNLNAGGSESKERIRDVQFTIGVNHDGIWGRRSAAAANAYLDGVSAPAPAPAPEPDAPAGEPLYSLMVNDVVVVSSPDINAIDEIKQGLFQAGVEATILVNVQ